MSSVELHDGLFAACFADNAILPLPYYRVVPSWQAAVNGRGPRIKSIYCRRWPGVLFWIAEAFDLVFVVWPC